MVLNCAKKWQTDKSIKNERNTIKILISRYANFANYIAPY